MLISLLEQVFVRLGVCVDVYICLLVCVYVCDCMVLRLSVSKSMSFCVCICVSIRLPSKVVYPMPPQEYNNFQFTSHVNQGPNM